MGVYLEKTKEPLDIPKALKAFIGSDEYEVYRFIDSDVYGYVKPYNTYKIVTGNGAFVLKKYSYPEDLEAEEVHYRLLSGLPVPRYLGSAEGCSLMGFAEGRDLTDPADEAIAAAAESLVRIMNAFPMGEGYDKQRYDKYLNRLDRRELTLASEPKLLRAFGLFKNRQREIPLTLSNADLLPINLLYDGKRALIIDWEFGGFLPYALDIARFIAHATPDGSVTSFRMSDEQKALFTDKVYDGLEVKPEREVYDRDLLLARYNECIEILEYYLNDPTVERDKVFELYYPEANRLADEILGEE